MKKCLIFLIFLLSIVCFSQKIKFKKGNVEVDKTPIAKMDGKKNVYEFSNLNEELKFIVTVHSKDFSDGSNEWWIEITDTESKLSNEIMMKDLGFNLAFRKNIIANLMYEDLPILSMSGINEELLKEFVARDNERISVQMEKKEEEIIENIRLAKELYETKKIAINDKGIIFQNSIKIGSISRSVEKDPIGNMNYLYKVYDNNSVLVAEYYQRGGVNPDTKYPLTQDLLVLKKLVLPIKMETIKQNIAEDPNAKNIVATLLFNGFELGNQVTENMNKNEAEMKIKNKELYEDAKKNSANIYNQPGYVILANGERKDGIIYTLFEKIENPNTTNSNVSDLSEFGYKKRVYLKSNDLLSQEIFKSKDLITFCATKNDEKEKCYKGLYAKGEAKLILDYSMFYEILFEKDGYFILSEPSSPSRLIIKIPAQEEGLYVTEYKKEEKLTKNFNEYFNCSSLNISNYDLNSIDGLKKLIEDFQVNCR